MSYKKSKKPDRKAGVRSGSNFCPAIRITRNKVPALQASLVSLGIFTIVCMGNKIMVVKVLRVQCVG